MGKLHRKPTIAELDETINASLKEIELPAPSPEQPPKEDGEGDRVSDPAVETKSDDAPIPPETKTQTESTKQPDTKQDDESVDFEKRYRDSTAEAQILYSKNKRMAEAIEKAGDITDPTDEELAQEYPEWDEMSTFEQKIARDNVIHRKTLEAIRESAKDFKELDAWNRKVDAFVADPETLSKHPELEGKEESFRLFSIKPTRRGVDFDVLVSSFLYVEAAKKPSASRGQMFETGTAGTTEKPKPNDGKISVDDSIRLRQTDYKKYLEYVRSGKIDESIT